MISYTYYPCHNDPNTKGKCQKREEDAVARYIRACN
jgi:hypothetical protein